MSNRSGRIHFDREQIDYLLWKTGEDDTSLAVEMFMDAVRKEKVDPFKIEQYLARLMEMDKGKYVNRK
jgi:hypothetical protein